MKTFRVIYGLKRNGVRMYLRCRNVNSAIIEARKIVGKGVNIETPELRPELSEMNLRRSEVLEDRNNIKLLLCSIMEAKATDVASLALSTNTGAAMFPTYGRLSVNTVRDMLNEVRIKLTQELVELNTELKERNLLGF